MCLFYNDHMCNLIESGCLGLQPKVGGEFLLNLNICKIPIDEKYREGLMKRTLKRELKVPEIAERKANGTSLLGEIVAGFRP